MSRIKRNVGLVASSNEVFRRHPVFMVPIAIVWLVYAPTVLYLRYRVDWDALTTSQALLVNLVAIFLFAFMLTISCSVLLELIEMLESGEKPSLRRAIKSTVGGNLVHMLPIIVVWTVIWFVLAVIQAALSRKKRRSVGSQPKFSAEDAARTLMGGGGKWSFSAAFFRALQKAVRMMVFLILPAIAWERLGFFRGVKRGLAIFKQHLSRFAEGFAMTEAMAFIVFLPPALVMIVTQVFDVTLPPAVWAAVIVYIGCAWSYSVYLEQMFMAELYLWHLKWERSGKAVSIDKIPPPQLLDRVFELRESAARNRGSSSLASAS
jgi:hypothetical protein